MKLSLLWLWFSPLVSAFPSAPSSRLSTRGDDQIPRLAMYVQTFTTAQNESVRLLPLVKENTGVTHVIISSFHLSTQAGEIHLNDNPPNSTQFDYLVCIFLCRCSILLSIAKKYVSGARLLLYGSALLFLVCGINILILFSGMRLKSSKQRELKSWQCWAELQEGPMTI